MLSALLSCVFAVLAIVAAGRNGVEVSFSLRSDTPARLQLFYGNEGDLAEDRSIRLSSLPGRPTVHTLAIGSGGARWLRLDPGAEGSTTLCDFEVEGAAAGYRLSPGHELSLEHASGCLALRPTEGARDPQVTLQFIGEAASRIDRARSWHGVFLLSLFFALASAAALGVLTREAWLPRVERLSGRLARLAIHAHWLCIGLMLLFGLAYALLTPPGAVADEEAHLAKVLRIVNGVPLGASGPLLLPNPRLMYGPFVDMAVNKRAFTADELRIQLRRPLECRASSAALARGADGYAPHQYAMPSLVYRLGCAAGVSFGAFLYLARVLNLLLAIALVGWGVKMAGRGKFALIFVALLPMTLFQLASISADSLVISASLAWLGLVSGIAGGKLALPRVGAMLWILSLAIAFMKPGSAWILGCLLFCKPAYDSAGRSFWLALGKHLVLPLLVHLIFTIQASDSAAIRAGVDPAANLALGIERPVAVLGVLVNTVVEHGGSLWRMLVGVLGWLDVPLSSWAYGLALALAAASVAGNANGLPRLPGYARVLALVMVAGSFLLLAVPLFLYWTLPDATSVQGLQGRYFLPTAAFALLWLSGAGLTALRPWLLALLALGAMTINLDGLWQLYQAYYVIGR